MQTAEESERRGESEPVNPSDFYVTGGTIPPDSPSYAARAADKQFLAALQRGELCYVLNARQMGKSSLSVRTRQALEQSGVKTAFLDLQRYGSSNTAEQWYLALLNNIGNDLKLRPAVLAYWRGNAEHSPLSRLFGALREVVLEQIPGNLVIFVDEIDLTRRFPFEVDEFFGAVRETYNARVLDPTLARLTFCIIGTVAPTDLIRDVRISPFNIGTRIALSDFTPSEAAPLAGPMPGGSKTLNRVLWWTSGHPYLTQRLCAELTRAQSVDVDAMVSRLFFAQSDAEVDENVKNVRNHVLRLGGEGAGFDRTDVLNRYLAIVSGKRVPDDDTDGVCTALRLSGLVTSSAGILQVRNRIYAKLFDATWVRANLPDAEVRRQRAAVAKARWQIGSLAIVILLMMGTLTGWALRNAKRADDNSALALRREKDATASAASERLAKHEADRERAEAQAQAQAALIAKQQAQASAQKADVALKGETEAKSAAVSNATQAKDQARRADQEAATAKTQTAAANHLAYISTINLIAQNIENGNYDVAEQFFADAERFPKTEHGFEWDYLKERMHLELLTLKGHTDWVNSVNFSSDGRRIVSGGSDKTARIWDAITGKELRILKGHTDVINSVAFSPDSKRIVTTSSDKTAKVWNAITGRELFTLKGHSDRVYDARFSSDGSRIATGSQDKTSRVWDASMGKELLILQGHTKGVSSVCFSPDGKKIVTGSWDNSARVWETLTGKELLRLRKHGEANFLDTVLGVAFSPDGKRIGTGNSDETARVYDSVTGQELLTLKGHTYAVRTINFSSDNKRIVTGSLDWSAKVWSAATGQELLTLKGHRRGVTSACFSPDGKRIVTGSGDNTVRVWDGVTDRGVMTLAGEANSLYPFGFSPDGKCIVSGSKVCNLITGQGLLTLKGHSDDITSACFSPDGKWIVTGGWDKTARVWNATTGRAVRSLKGHTDHVVSAKFSPDGTRIVTGSRDKTARVWDAVNGKELLTLKGHRDEVTNTDFSPDGTKIVTVSYGIAGIWDAVTGKKLLALKGYKDVVTSANFSPDGKRIVTGTFDGIARVWDAATSKELLTLKGHTDRITSANFSRDGKRIATCSSDRNVRVWDAATGKELLTLKGPHRLSTVSFSPDGSVIVTEDILGAVKVWRKVTAEQAPMVWKQVWQDQPLNELSHTPLSQLVEAARTLVGEKPELKYQVAHALNTAAWNAVTPDNAPPTAEIARQARDVAALAVEFSQEKEGDILDTLAVTQFDCGELDNAIATERKAIQRLSILPEMKERLKQYEALKAAGQTPK